MCNPNLQAIFSSINTYEEFVELKRDTTIFEQAVNLILESHNLKIKQLTLFSEGTNIVFAYDDTRVIKLFPPCHQKQFESDLIVLKHLQGKLSVATPNLEYFGEYLGWPYLIMSKLEGTLLETLWESLDHTNKSVILAELGALIKEVHSLSTKGLEAIDCHWEQFINKQITHCFETQRSTNLPNNLLEQIPIFLEGIESKLPQIKKPVLLTGEYTPMNFLVQQEHGIWHIKGLIDFGDAMLGLPEYDLLGPGAFLIQGDRELLHTFLIAYGYTPDQLTEDLSFNLFALMLLHQYSNLNVQIRIPGWQTLVTTLEELQQLVWDLT